MPKTSGISWLTMTAVNPNFRWVSTIRSWMVRARRGSSPVVGSSNRMIARATAATADDRGQHAPRKLKVDAVQDRLAAERLLQPYEADHRVRCTATHHNNAGVRK